MTRTQVEKAWTWERTQGGCWYCGEPPNPFTPDYHIDHYLPVARGGSHKLDNLVPCCAQCNLEKGNKTVEEFRADRGGGTFWFEREGLTIAQVPPSTALDCRTFMFLELFRNVFTQGQTSFLTPRDRKEARVVSLLKKHGDMPYYRLQQGVSSYGIYQDDLVRIRKTLCTEGRIQEYQMGRVQYIRWTGEA